MSATKIFWAASLVLLGGCPEVATEPAPFFTAGPQPRELEDVVRAERTPPPISGGTLFASQNRHVALASDPDRDVVWAIDTAGRTHLGRVELELGDEPGRIVEDADNRFHVVLRGAGEILTIDGGDWTASDRRAVCAAPRGIDHNPENDTLVVACEGGELVTLPAAGGPATAMRILPRDLRDVVVQGDMTFVSRFRSAEVLRIPTAEVGVEGPVPEAAELLSVNNMEPSVAYRMIDSGDGGVALLHQMSQTGGGPVSANPAGGYYGNGSCATSIVMGGVSTVSAQGSVEQSRPLLGMILPVDFATGGGQVATVSAGNRNDGVVDQARGLGQTPAIAVSSTSGALTTDDYRSREGGCTGTDQVSFGDSRQVVSVAYTAGDQLIVQTRNPWQIVFTEETGESLRSFTGLDLPGIQAKDTGHDLFHEDSGAGIACASCHAEGGDDGVTWNFDFGELGVLPRRTQDMRGGLLGSEPFHWAGDMDDFGTLVDEVFSGRMAGPVLPDEHMNSLARWIDLVPAPVPGVARDPLAVERGRAAFESEATECASCHTGSRLSNNDTVDVGTGEMLQVPSLLGVGLRSPLMHDGCASDLTGRFDEECGGGDQHGVTSHLTEAEIADMVAYMGTL